MRLGTPEVRDPVRGAIPVTPRELAVIDHRLFQRLRHIRQLGFTELSFPGATHNRLLHSIGAMHLAGLAFDGIFDGVDVPEHRRRELRALLRAAALLHDVGHAPMSHASEFAMPPVGDLQIPAYAEAPDAFPATRQASHEDYTIKIVTDSSLTPSIEAAVGLPARAVAGLVDPRIPVDPSWYEASGVDWRPMLQQLISSELDVDRMDYLGRDAHFTGVHYGVFDVNWLMNHLQAWIDDGKAYLALDARAVYAFEDFLIARYHMFLMVYFHYRSVAYEEMLQRWFTGGGDGYRIPSDVEEYAGIDDAHLQWHLRRSQDPWARRIVDRTEYKLLVERHGAPRDIDLSRALVRLSDGGVPTISAASTGVLSKYFQGREAAPAVQGQLPLGSSRARPATVPIYVLERPYRGSKELRARPLEHSTELFERYRDQLMMSRIYVPPEDVARAGKLIADVV